VNETSIANKRQNPFGSYCWQACCCGRAALALIPPALPCAVFGVTTLLVLLRTLRFSPLLAVPLSLRSGILMVGDIIPEWWAELSRNGWAASFRNHGRLAPVSAIDENPKPVRLFSTVRLALERLSQRPHGSVTTYCQKWELMLTYSVEQSDGSHPPSRPRTSRTRKMTTKM
jgi:hypothetical protein